MTMNRPSPRRGVAAVELALIAPVFALFLVGMLELSRVLIVKAALNDAARTGCRSGILPGHGMSYPAPGSTGSNIASDVGNVLQSNNLDPTQATLTVTVGASDPSTYSLAGTAPNYTATLTSGPGVDSLRTASGIQIQVKVAMPVSSFTWGFSKFVTPTTLESEMITMNKQ